MSLAINSEIHTEELTNGSILVTESDGIVKISICNPNSDTSGTVLGTRKLAGRSSSVINVAKNQTVTYEANKGSVIKNLTINAPLGCTLQITAQ